MKRLIVLLSCVAVLLTLPVNAYATENKNADSPGVAITVVIPQKSEPTKATPTPEPKKPPTQYLYPISVWETQENGRQEIIKTYELGADEKPENISRESFTRNGWFYELTDITKNETASATVKEHTETVEVATNTKDMEAILKLLAPEMEYKSDDGYVGVLSLDITSITIETAGTKKSSYTVSATREYPHLSSNDTSLVPKTISDNGRTLTLSGVIWKSQSTETVDYDQIPASYTAIASYTTSASKISITGYTTTAKYSGTISKIATGKTVYTAYFTGIPIVTPTGNAPTTNKGGGLSEATVAPTPTESPSPEPTTTLEPANTTEPSTTLEPSNPSEKPSVLQVLILCMMTATAIIGGANLYSTRKKKEIKIDKESEPLDEEINKHNS